MSLTKLEGLIIDLASQCVRQVSGFSGKLMSEEDVFDSNTHFLEGSAYTQLALIADNGMSPEAQFRLKAIEKELAAAMAGVREEQQGHVLSLCQQGKTPPIIKSKGL